MRSRNDRSAIAEDLERILELFPRVRQRLEQRAGTLSGGEQQMVAMARALMGRPKLICMDEPTMGLSPLYVDRVLELVRDINQAGTSVFMVEQNASLALQIAHRGYVLQTGRIVLTRDRRRFCATTRAFAKRISAARSRRESTPRDLSRRLEFEQSIGGQRRRDDQRARWRAGGGDARAEDRRDLFERRDAQRSRRRTSL